MGSLYRVAATVCLILAVCVAVNESIAAPDLLAAVLVAACGVFCVAGEVREMREGPKPAKPVERPLLPKRPI